MIDREELAERLQNAVEEIIEINACKQYTKKLIKESIEEEKELKNKIKNIIAFQKSSSTDISKLNAFLAEIEKKINDIKEKILVLSIQEIQLSEQAQKDSSILSIDGTIRNSPFTYYQRLNSQLILQKSILKKSIGELESLRNLTMCFTKYDDEYTHENEISELITQLDNIQVNSEEVSDELQGFIKQAMDNAQTSDIIIYEPTPNIDNPIAHSKYNKYIEERPSEIYNYLQDMDTITELLEKAKNTACNGTNIASIAKIYSLITETKELINKKQKKLNQICEMSPEHFQKIQPLNESFTQSRILVDALISKINIFFEINQKRSSACTIKQLELPAPSELNLEKIDDSQLKEISLLEEILNQAIDKLPDSSEIFQKSDPEPEESIVMDELGFNFADEIKEIIDLQNQIAAQQDQQMNEITSILELLDDYNHEEDEIEDNDENDENEETIETEVAKEEKEESRLIPKFEPKPPIEINTRVEIKPSYSSGGQNKYASALKQVLTEFHDSMISPEITEKVTALREAVSIMENDYREALSEAERRISHASERVHKAKSEISKTNDKIQSLEKELSSSSSSLKPLREAAMQSRNAKDIADELDRVNREIERIQTEIQRAGKRQSEHSNDRRQPEHSNDRRQPEHSNDRRQGEHGNDRRERPPPDHSGDRVNDRRRRKKDQRK